MSFAQPKTRAGMNRTMEVLDVERCELSSQTLQLNEHSSLAEIRGKIINQDIFECLEFLPKNFVDLLIIDPPYNLTKKFGETKFSRRDEQDYENWVESWLSKLVVCLKPNASIYVCCDWKSSAPIQRVLERYFIVRNRISWEREKGRGAKANWKNCSEDIWFCTMSDDYFFDVEAVKLKKKVIAPYRDVEGAPKDWEETEHGNFRLTHASNLWTDISIPFWSMPENTDHPTQKPEKLIAKLILASSKQGDLVFDPFLGSGTTCVTAKKLDRNFCGIEIEADYSNLAVKRLQKAETDKSIQGYHDGYFWERNSLSAQKTTSKKGTTDISSKSLFDE
jgi:site-specific DNA-methyltransferase (adenine-specific)